ncbi:hypothetical protein MYCTH_2313350 [Thermothelomyces thermophilus ATCC 42464]|uniref:Uncharacterized protein n=1 Tax=Thermothelomyces thermophilus (strain ATCC 42464 / BCRC 31852 / DSM 1799) TaxID=573729 RepID=G2Q1U1_THET4|nr:uncharacterized protein MYCTH_2313350 [Thermothelomyces thermophilus ATCC 42464]AEO53375.1 hypothetical protein MYCTH_2313350 [Thermothelomyces thermophilus ATCC 42464]
MNARGYGLPTYPGCSTYLPAGSRNYHDQARKLSLCDLSLSDDNHSEHMPCWVKDRKSNLRVSGIHDPANKQRDLKAPPAPQCLGIDAILRNLHHEISSSLKMLQALVQCFEADVEALRPWAEESTLDTVWRNKVKKVFRGKRDKARFEGVAGRISASRAAIKGAVRTVKTVKAAWEDRHTVEGQIRTAKKAIVFCDGIVDLAERAASERAACKQLVTELEETICLLDRRKHPWICKSALLSTCPPNLKASSAGPGQ